MIMNSFILSMPQKPSLGALSNEEYIPQGHAYWSNSG